jgi:large subunit ribosomal protein L5
MKFFLNNFISDKMLLICNYKNIREILNLKKIVLHFSIKDTFKNPKKIISAYLVLSLLSQNKSFLVSSKKSIMILKIRKGMVISSKVTLRKHNMFNFLNMFNLINFFKLNNSWGSNKKSLDIKTISLRISELYAFPKLEKFFDFFDELPFLSVVIVSNSNNKLHFQKLLSLLGILK